MVFEDTVKANLQLANPPNAGGDGDMWRVLEIVELAERFAQDAEGLGTWLGSAGNRLSGGGEARRLVLARVLLSQAPVVILDEPFTGVDEATRTRISPPQISRWLQGGRTVVCLGHGPDACWPPTVFCTWVDQRVSTTSNVRPALACRRSSNLPSSAEAGVQKPPLTSSFTSKARHRPASPSIFDVEP